METELSGHCLEILLNKVLALRELEQVFLWTPSCLKVNGVNQGRCLLLASSRTKTELPQRSSILSLRGIKN